jgi:hypothetical protein
VILRILAQESPNSKLCLERYGGKKFEWQNWKFGSLWGIFGNTKYLEVLCVKKQVCNCNLDKD